MEEKSQQVRVPYEAYELLRKEAFERDEDMSVVVGELIKKALGA
jgi:AmiR/NasT family two-component response regulator